MTKAGLDPSKIQERAEMLAKVQGAKRKRNADVEDVEMDDNDEDDVSGSDKGMDVDDEGSPAKRVKTNSGGVINRRAPRSNRHTAGMRDEGVSWFLESPLQITNSFFFSNSLVQPNFAILVNVLAICLRKQEKEIVLSELKW